MSEKKCKLLIADDDRDVLDTVRRYFEPRGFQVGVVRDGFECLSSISQSVPDVLLLDLKMKRMDGDKTILEIREQCPYTRVLVITGSQDEALKNKISKMGIDGLYEKPVSLPDLHADIKALLRAPSNVMGQSNPENLSLGQG